MQELYPTWTRTFENLHPDSEKITLTLILPNLSDVEEQLKSHNTIQWNDPVEKPEELQKLNKMLASTDQKIRLFAFGIIKEKYITY